MHILEKKIKIAESAYEMNKSGANALALFARYVFAGKTIEKDGIYLSKAYHVAVTAHKEDVLDLRILAATLYANILLENYESAYEIIRQLEPHSSFLSKNSPLFYGQVLYFYSIVQTKLEKSRSARKIQRNLEILYEKTEQTPLIAYLGGIQRYAYGDVAICAKMYYEAMKKGLRSVFFYLDAYEILIEQETYTEEMNELAKGIIPWALTHDLPVDKLLERLEKRTLIGILFSLGTTHLSKVYELYGHVGAFQCLCQKLIFEGDTKERALSYYMLALENKLNLRGLEQISVKAAYENKYYALPLSVVETALGMASSYDANELAFLFGILASKYRNTEAFGEFRENLVKFGMWALSKDMRGKDFNFVYRFVFDIFPEDERLAEIMFEELFSYEIEFGKRAPSCVCVSEYAKKGMYAYPVEGNKCCVKSIGKFDCYFLGEDSREYLNINDYKITKMMEDVSVELYELLYKRGFQDADIVAAIAMNYLGRASLDKTSIDYLQRATGMDVISSALKSDIYLRLASHYAEQEQYSIAVHYYSLIADRELDGDNVRGALNAYIATGKYEAAISLIEKKKYALSDATIFDYLKIIYEYADSLEIAAICYKLILNDMCAVEVLSVVFRYFKGTPDEWLLIANKIDSLGFDVTQLYEKIIVNGIFTGSIGNDCNEAFARLYSIEKSHPVIIKYVYFCCYEIIRNGKQLPDNIVAILDEIYSKDDSDDILCCALALNYMRAGRQDKLTLLSEAAMYMEEAGIILPEFKRYQDKSFICSYIEKNTPFVYYQAAHRNVFFCYKTDGGGYSKKKMSYYRFGLYTVNVPLFYGERITYYFEEENGFKTEPEEFVKTHMRIIEQFNDQFYKVNNAIIYERMMKFDMVEQLIDRELGAGQQFPIITL